MISDFEHVISDFEQVKSHKTLERHADLPECSLLSAL